MASRPTLRIALAQVNPVVGDLLGNADLIRGAALQAAAAGAHLVLLPEMCLTGYPIEDLALNESFQDAAHTALTRLARDIAEDGNGDLTCLVGALDIQDAAEPSASRPRAPLNVAAVIRDGHVQARYVKHHLPNYGVFDELRQFERGTTPLIIDVAGHRVCVAICEDLWRAEGPVEWARAGGADLLAVLNASPYEHGKSDRRLELCVERAAQSGATVAYVNLVGGQDELVFDGDSLVVDPGGVVLGRAARFSPDLLLVDVDAGHRSAGDIRPQMSGPAEVYAALELGLRDYVDKNGFGSVLLGLSGGIDSALVAALACDAIGPDRVHGVALPSVYSSGHSVEDAYDLADRTGLSIRTVPIAPMVDSFMAALHLQGLAEENLQARVRGTVLMGLSNAEGHLVLATGNKSELAVGYSTLYGDAVGGYAPIKDVPKTLVWDLARWRNATAAGNGQREPIPPRSIEKPPSAELRPGQQDTDSLPPYEVLDQVLEAYVTADSSVAGLVDAGYPVDLVERVVRLTDLAEYKRRQYPPGTRISARAFGRDRRRPITNHWRESGTVTP